MTTQEIVKAQERRVASLGLEDEAGLHGDLDQDDVALPMCSITQPTSASERGDPGKFWFNDGRSVNEMKTAVLDIIGTRTFWAPKGKSSIDGIICRSTNRRDGIARYPAIVLSPEPDKETGAQLDSTFLACDKCPHFNDDQYAGGDYLCKKGYTLVMADTTSGDVFLYFVKGSAMKMVIRRIVSPAIARKQRGEPAAPWLTPFTWTAKIKENQKGKFYVPEVVPGPQFSDKDAARYAELSAQFGGRAAEQMEAEDLEEPDAEQAQPAAAPSDGAKQRPLPRN